MRFSDTIAENLLAASTANRPGATTILPWSRHSLKRVRASGAYASSRINFSARDASMTTYSGTLQRTVDLSAALLVHRTQSLDRVLPNVDVLQVGGNLLERADH